MTRNNRNNNLRLTPRQKEILFLFSEGRSYEQIAKKLGISKETVRSHLMTVRIHFDVNKTIGAVAIAVSRQMFA